MFLSLDCMHYKWKNCLAKWQVKIQTEDGKRSIILEVIANHTWTSRWKEASFCMVKGARGAKVKVLFQGLHMTHVILWFIISKFIFQVPLLKLHFKYKYILITNWFFIMYIMHSCPLSHIYEQHLLKSHFWNPYI